MNIGRIRAVAVKECLHVMRDRRSLALGILIPMLMLFLFGYALNMDVDQIPMAVWDRADSLISRELISRFSGSEYFLLNQCVSGYDEIEKLMFRRKIMMALVIPENYGIPSADSGTVQLIIDGSDTTTAGIASSYCTALTNLSEVSRGSSVIPSIRVWFNEEIRSRNYIVPGLIVIIMMMISALLTSLTVAKEWESGTMECLIPTPLTPAEILTGKIIPYFLIAAIDVVLSTVTGTLIFGVPLRGSIFLLGLSSVIFLICALMLGMFISIINRKQLTASQFALMGTFLPAFLLSGFMFDISNMPLPVQTVTRIVPARYFVTVTRGIFLKGTGIKELYPELLTLLLITAVLTALSLLSFKKRIQ